MAKQFLTNIDLNQGEIQNAALHKLASAPAMPTEGQVYFNTGAGKAYVWLGITWRELTNPLDLDILAALMGVDGDGSGLDADLLDGQHGTFYRARASHTGTQSHSTISDFDAGVRTNRLNEMAAPTAAISMGNQRITSLADPSVAQDAATKAYVDSARVGLDFKDSVRTATTANIALSGMLLISGNEVALSVGDRVLVRAQTAPAANGIYVVASGAWTRATDAAAGSLSTGAFTFVEEGVEDGGTAFVLQTFGGTVGTSAQNWVVFSAVGDTAAGAGLFLTGAHGLSVGAGAGIIVNPDAVAIDTAVVARKATFSVGGAASQVLTHGLGTRDVAVSVVRATAPYDQVECDVEATSTTTITLRFAVAPAASAFRAVVVG